MCMYVLSCMLMCICVHMGIVHIYIYNMHACAVASCKSLSVFNVITKSI